jgi:hypothetical protein
MINSQTINKQETAVKQNQNRTNRDRASFSDISTEWHELNKEKEYGSKPCDSKAIFEAAIFEAAIFKAAIFEGAIFKAAIFEAAIFEATNTKAIFEPIDTKATFDTIDTKATFEAIPTVFAGSFLPHAHRAEDIIVSIIDENGRTTLKISDPITGFRLPKTMLAKVDSLCVEQDLTRSQVFRRSIMEYLKGQNAIATDVNQPEPRPAWPAELFEREHRM